MLKQVYVLLHGCCHNPTGASLNMTQWEQVIDSLIETGATPMIDIAYQGFGDGLEEDAAPTRLVAKSVPECIIAASCSRTLVFTANVQVWYCNGSRPT